MEAYGRGDIKGGLVIIDEPEIHLHYQFQNEYVRVIEKLNREQGCQYVLVTHSESLISSETIERVIRVSLNDEGYTQISQPALTTDQKWLVKILDNKRSTHAFFGSKVLLVEGEDDRYFFRACLGEIEEKLKKGFTQDITILDINGRDSETEWRNLFTSFGLKVFIETDLDYALKKFYPSEPLTKLNTPHLTSQFLTNHTDVISKIENEYLNNTFILKEGDLESYLGIQKGLEHVIDFCRNNLATYFSQNNSKVTEIKMILSKVTGENETTL
jgi:predicted ATP-dependent endonuclease of OLD family